MADKINPTITLAEVYEEQNQFIDALLIYQKIKSRNPSEQLDEKIEILKKKIFAKHEDHYSPIIDKIFTPEDKIAFKIIPHNQYHKYVKSQQVSIDDDLPPLRKDIAQSNELLEDVSDEIIEPPVEAETEVKITDQSRQDQIEKTGSQLPFIDDTELEKMIFKKKKKKAIEEASPVLDRLREEQKNVYLYDADERDGHDANDFFNKPFETVGNKTEQKLTNVLAEETKESEKVENIVSIDEAPDFQMEETEVTIPEPAEVEELHEETVIQEEEPKSEIAELVSPSIEVGKEIEDQPIEAKEEALPIDDEIPVTIVEVCDEKPEALIEEQKLEVEAESDDPNYEEKSLDELEAELKAEFQKQRLEAEEALKLHEEENDIADEIESRENIPALEFDPAVSNLSDEILDSNESASKKPDESKNIDKDFWKTSFDDFKETLKESTITETHAQDSIDPESQIVEPVLPAEPAEIEPITDDFDDFKEEDVAIPIVKHTEIDLNFEASDAKPVHKKTDDIPRFINEKLNDSFDNLEEKVDDIRKVEKPDLTNTDINEQSIQWDDASESEESFFEEISKAVETVLEKPDFVKEQSAELVDATESKDETVEDYSHAEEEPMLNDTDPIEELEEPVSEDTTKTIEYEEPEPVIDIKIEESDFDELEIENYAKELLKDLEDPSSESIDEELVTEPNPVVDFSEDNIPLIAPEEPVELKIEQPVDDQTPEPVAINEIEADKDLEKFESTDLDKLEPAQILENDEKLTDISGDLSDAIDEQEESLTAEEEIKEELVESSADELNIKNKSDTEEVVVEKKALETVIEDEIDLIEQAPAAGETEPIEPVTGETEAVEIEEQDVEPEKFEENIESEVEQDIEDDFGFKPKKVPDVLERESEYLPNSAKSKDDFFNMSFDDVIAKTQVDFRKKNIGFKAEDIRSTEKKKD
jgi:hypothetical protein